MKIQLAAEDVEAQMHELSDLIITRVAAAAEESGHVRSELVTISHTVEELSQRATTHERSYASDVSRLKQLDAIKARMESARSTLKVTHMPKCMLGD